MTVSYVSIGSNVEKHFHIEKAITALMARYPSFLISPIYESPAFGFEGDSFFNLVVEMETDQTLEQFSHALRTVEFELGRPLDAKKKQSRTIDLDIILFGDCVCEEPIQLPRQDIYHYPFVIQPLYDINPELVVPGDGQTIRDIWVKSKNLKSLSAVTPWFEI